MDDNVKTIDELMEYLNSKDIKTTEDDRISLINYGYFHGYKGYRFYKDERHPFLIKDFKEIAALIEFDTQLKSLFYEKIMFIETALKNITLTKILEINKSSSLNDFFEKSIISYNNCPKFYNEDQKIKAEENLLKLKTIINDINYQGITKKDQKILHFYKFNNSSVPLYSIFENITMGEFGFLFTCLKYEYRKAISDELKINTMYDFDKTIICDYIYLLKNLRNAIAHNNVVFDCRFKKPYHIKNVLKKHINFELKAFAINFESITDYTFLILYFLKILNVSFQDIFNFITKYELIIENFNQNISQDIFKMIFNTNHYKKVISVKTFLLNSEQL